MPKKQVSLAKKNSKKTPKKSSQKKQKPTKSNLAKKKSSSIQKSRKTQSPSKKKSKLLENQIELEGLYEKVCDILQTAKQRVVQRANVEMVRAYWLVGQSVVEHEQKGKNRANYGQQTIKLLSKHLTEKLGKGFTTTNLKYMRQFYLAFPKGHSLRDELSWTHYRLLLKIEKLDARMFYEKESAEQNWSTRELDRQITTLFYERTLLSQQKREMLTQNHDRAEKYNP